MNLDRLTIKAAEALHQAERFANASGHGDLTSLHLLAALLVGKAIVEIQLVHLRDRLAARERKLTLTDAAKARLARDGYDPAYGARPLKRLVQQEIENPLARRILEGRFAPGDEIVIDLCGETFAFEKK